MGRRLLRQWLSKPLINPEAIRRRQDIVAFFFTQGMLRAELRARLKGLGDLERLTNVSLPVMPGRVILQIYAAFYAVYLQYTIFSQKRFLHHFKRYLPIFILNLIYARS